MLFVVLRILDNSKFLLSVGTLVELCLHIALDAKCKHKGLEVWLVEVLSHWLEGKWSKSGVVFIDFIRF